METRERSTAAPAAGNGPELDWRELGRRVSLRRQAELLRGLPRELLATIAPLLRRASARPGELIYREGEPAACFFLVESGEVSRFQGDDGEAWSEQLGPGASCGDAVLWAGAVYRASARAETETVLWEVHARDLEELRRASEPLDSALRALRPGVEAPAELERGRGASPRGRTSPAQSKQQAWKQKPSTRACTVYSFSSVPTGADCARAARPVTAAGPKSGGSAAKLLELIPAGVRRDADFRGQRLPSGHPARPDCRPASASRHRPR